MNKSIYPEFSQPLTRIFERTPANRILLVPVDFAKAKHVVRFCDGTGRYLSKRPLTVHNNLNGVKFLKNRIEGARKRYNVQKKNVVLGGEDVPQYAVNFVHAFRREGYQFVRVNPAQAAERRKNRRASSDTLALDGIARTIIDRRAHDVEIPDEIFAELKAAALERHRQVKRETAAKNAVHRSVELLFPGYFDVPGVSGFGPASLALLQDNFSVQRIRRRGHDGLVALLKRHGAPEPDQVALALKAAAQRAAPPTYLGREPDRLANKVRMLQCIRDVMADEEQKMAECLVQTPGFFLTTIPGMGVVLSGQIYARLGPEWRSVADICSYCGIVPREVQTGGPDQPALKGHLPVDCNRTLKSYVMQAAHHVGTTLHPIRRLSAYDGVHQLYRHYHAVEEREGKSLLSTAQKLIRIGRRLILDATFYVPDHWLKDRSAVSPQEIVDYYTVTATCLRKKWQGYDLSSASDDANELSRLIHSLQEVCKCQQKLTTGGPCDGSWPDQA